MAFRFPKTKKKVEFPGILRPPKKDIGGGEILTGFINGRKASELEERFANSLRSVGLGFYFQWIMNTEYTLPDQAKNVDFIVYVGNRVYPVEIYGSYFHSSAGDRLHDANRERELNREFDKFGWERLTIIWDYELFDQTQADNTVRRLFLT